MTAKPARNSGPVHSPLIVVVLLSLFVATIIYVSLFAREQGLTELYQKARADLSQYHSSVGQRLERFQSLPPLLAEHDLLRRTIQAGATSEDIEAANRFLVNAAELVNALDIYVMDAGGTTRAASNWLKETSFIGRNFAFRPYFTTAMEGKPGRYFALGSTTNKRGYYFSYPISDAQRQIIGAIVVKIDLDQIEERWSDPNTEILVADGDGVVVISTRPDWMFRTLRPLSGEQMQRIVDSLRYGSQPLDALNLVFRSGDEGHELVTLLEGSRISGDTLSDVSAQQYFRIRQPIEGTDLEIHMLVSLVPLEEQMFLAQVATTILFAVLLLSWLLVMLRRRIVKERAMFQQREEQVRQENEARIAGIINNTNAGLSLIDTEGNIEYFNPVLEYLFGYPLAQMTGQPFLTLLAESDQALMQRYILLEVDTHKQNLKLEVDCIRSDGSLFPVELTLNSMELGGRYHLIITLVDITERRQHIRQLEQIQNDLERRVEDRTADLQAANLRLMAEIQNHEQTQNELVQATKLAVIGQMSAGINHELNQPLTAIRNYADNALKFLALSKPQRAEHNLKEIAGLTERMARIIHPLKEFARKSERAASGISLRDLRDGAMSILYGQLEKQGVSIHWPAGLEQIWVRGDLLRLEQVLVNLLNNAIQAMQHSERKEIRISLYLDDPQRVVIGVRDSGPGLSGEALNHVFEPFFTTKSKGEGLGLGLSISQRIVASLGGQLSVVSPPDGGAEFLITLLREDRTSAAGSEGEAHSD